MESYFWLLVSMSGGILVSFGILEYFKINHINPLYLVVGGVFMVGLALKLKKFRTETSVALKRGRK